MANVRGGVLLGISCAYFILSDSREIEPYFNSVLKTTSTENHNGRRPQWKATSVEADLKDRQPQQNMTSIRVGGKSAFFSLGNSGGSKVFTNS